MMMASALGFTTVNSLCCYRLLFPSAPSIVSVTYQISTVSSSSSSSSLLVRSPACHTKLNPFVRASTEGIPSELIEDSKFFPLNADDPRFGPPALLLLGFELGEAEKIQQLLKELDGDFMEIIYCTQDMITSSLWEAMNTRQPNLEKLKIAKSLPRICFLSGLSGEEMMMFIDAFPETGLEPAVFAALVPNSADKPLQELIEEIMGDHEMLTGNDTSLT